MDGKMTLEQAIALLDSYGKDHIGCIAWRSIKAHLAQPAQAVDVWAIREVITDIKERPSWTWDSSRRSTLADKLTRAIGN